MNRSRGPPTRRGAWRAISALRRASVRLKWSKLSRFAPCRTISVVESETSGMAGVVEYGFGRDCLGARQVESEQLVRGPDRLRLRSLGKKDFGGVRHTGQRVGRGKTDRRRTPLIRIRQISWRYRDQHPGVRRGLRPLSRLAPQSICVFVWRTPEGRIFTGRAQTRIPSKAETDQLWRLAEEQGWAHLQGD